MMITDVEREASASEHECTRREGRWEIQLLCFIPYSLGSRNLASLHSNIATDTAFLLFFGPL